MKNTLYVAFAFMMATALQNCSNNPQKKENSDVKITDTLESGNENVNDSLIEQYRLELDKLDKSNVRNVGKAMNVFFSWFKNQSKTTCDKGFALFTSFHTILGNQFINNEPPAFKSEKEEKNYLDTLYYYGFCLRSAEGGQYIAHNINKSSLVVQAYPYLSDSMVAYLQQQKHEDDHFFADDGGLVIEPNELVDRMIWWEDFFSKIDGLNGDFPFRYEVQGNFFLYRNLMIKGIENTPLVYVGEEGINPYFKSAYDYLLGKHSGTPSAILFKPYYKSLLDNDSTFILEFQTNYYDDPKE